MTIKIFQKTWNKKVMSPKKILPSAPVVSSFFWPLTQNEFGIESEAIKSSHQIGHFLFVQSAAAAAKMASIKLFIVIMGEEASRKKRWPKVF